MGGIDMKINYNPTKMKDEIFEDFIKTHSSLFLKSKSNTYVVFDSSLKIFFEGTLDECYVYQMEYKTTMGFTPSIYSKEAYEDFG